MSHTPGPWTIEYEDDEGNLLDDGVTIESCEGPVAFRVIDCSAHVIAAAPELLAALADTVARLEMIASDMRGGLFGHNIGLADYEAGVRRCYERAAAAIAKAEGRE